MNKISIGDNRISMHIGNPTMNAIMGAIANSADGSIDIYADDNGSLACVVAEGCYIATTSEQFVSEVLDVLPSRIDFCAVSNFVVEYLSSRYALEWATPCYMYSYNGKPYDNSALDGLDIRPLTAEHWQLVSDGTPYKPDKSRVVDDIVNRISSAIYVNNQPVSWCVLHRDNSLGMLYTLPEYRGRGYGVKMVIAQCIKLLDMGQIPYSCVIKGNKVAENITDKYNVDYVCDVTWCGIDKEKN